MPIRKGGSDMDKLETTVTMKGIAKYTVPAFTGYGVQTKYVYTMESEDGTIYVWKTTTYFTIKVRDDARGWEEDSKGRKWAYWAINRGDIIRIKAGIISYHFYFRGIRPDFNRFDFNDALWHLPI